MDEYTSSKTCPRVLTLFFVIFFSVPSACIGIGMAEGLFISVLVLNLGCIS